MASKDDSKASKDDSKADNDGVQAVENTAAAIQEATDEAEEKGYFGDPVDETPRENYTVAGVVAGKPVPEVPETKE